MSAQTSFHLTQNVLQPQRAYEVSYAQTCKTYKKYDVCTSSYLLVMPKLSHKISIPASQVHIDASLFNSQSFWQYFRL